MKINLFLTLFLVSFYSQLSPQSITVTAPNGGEEWAIGSAKTIQWTADGTRNPFKITLWRNNALIHIIDGNVPAGNGILSYTWLVGKYDTGYDSISGDGFKISVKEKAVNVSDTSDNPFKIVSPQAKPDLCVSGRISVQPEFPKIGDRVTVSATITNLNASKSPPCAAKLTITGPEKFQTINKYFNVPSLSNLLGDGLNAQSIRYHYTVREMGVYKNVLKVDSHDVIEEDNEENNEKSRFTRVDPVCDLAVYVTGVGDIRIFGNKKVTTEVKNIGPGISPPSKLWLFLEGASHGGANVLDVPALNPGQSIERSISNRFYVPGKKAYKSWIDFKEEITELNEANNIESGHFHVYIGDHFDPGGIDPECLAISFSAPIKTKINERVTLIAKVKNQYPNKSAPFKINFIVQDHRTTTFHIPELFPNEVFDVPYSARWSNAGTKQFSVTIISSDTNCQECKGSIAVEALTKIRP